MTIFPTSTACRVLVGLLAASPLGATNALAQAGGWVDPPSRSRTPDAAREPARDVANEPAKGGTPAPQPPSAASPAAPPAVVVAPDASTARPDAAPTRQGQAPAQPPASAGPPAPASRSAEGPAPGREPARGRDEPASASSARRAASSVARVRSARIRAARSVRMATASSGAPLVGDLTPYAAASRRLAIEYLSTMSGSGPAVAAAGRLYGPTVALQGRPTALAAVLAEKRRFIARWPERSYRPYLAELTVACNAALGACVVRTPFAFAAESPTRGALSRGTGLLVLGVRFEGGRPVIASEASRVLSRERLARVAPPPEDEDDDDAE